MVICVKINVVKKLERLKRQCSSLRDRRGETLRENSTKTIKNVKNGTGLGKKCIMRRNRNS